MSFIRLGKEDTKLMTGRRAIFSAFEPPSSDEEDGGDEDEEDVEEEDQLEDDDDVGAFEKRLVEKTAKLRLEVNGEEDDEDEGGTGVMMSQLRHFVIQVN